MCLLIEHFGRTDAIGLYEHRHRHCYICCYIFYKTKHVLHMRKNIKQFYYIIHMSLQMELFDHAVTIDFYDYHLYIVIDIEFEKCTIFYWPNFLANIKLRFH